MKECRFGGAHYLLSPSSLLCFSIEKGLTVDIVASLHLHILQSRFFLHVSLMLLIETAKLKEALFCEAGVENGKLFDAHALLRRQVIAVFLAFGGGRHALCKGAVHDSVARLVVLEELLSLEGVLG